METCKRCEAKVKNIYDTKLGAFCYYCFHGFDDEIGEYFNNKGEK